MSTPIQRLARTARLSGAAEVYDYARGELSDRELGRLLLHLRGADPDWRPPPKERRRLAARLLEDGVSDKDIVAQTSISRTTLWRMRRDLPRQPRKHAFQSGANVSNGGSPAHGSSGPVSAPRGGR